MLEWARSLTTLVVVCGSGTFTFVFVEVTVLSIATTGGWCECECECEVKIIHDCHFGRCCCCCYRCCCRISGQTQILICPFILFVSDPAQKMAYL